MSGVAGGTDPDPMQRGAFLQTFHTGLGIIFLNGLAFVTGILIARGLTLEEQGRFQLVISLSVFVTMLGMLGLDEAATYLLPRFQAHQPGKVFSLIVYLFLIPALVSAGIGGVFFFGSEVMADRVFGVEGVAYDLRFGVALFPAMMLLQIGLAILRALGRSEWRASIYYYLVSILFLAGILWGMAVGLTPDKVYATRILSLVAGGTVAAILIFRSVGLGDGRISFPEIRKLHSFAGLMMCIGAFQFLIEQPLLDLIIVGHNASAEAVGLYSVASRVGALVAVSGVALNVVMAPLFAQAISRDDLRGLRDHHGRASRWMAAGAIAIGTLLLVFPREVLLLFGSEYQAARPILLIFVAGQMVVGLLGLNAPLLIVMGFGKIELLLSGATVALMVGSAIVLGRIYGPVGVAGATAACGVALALARRLVIARVIRWTPNDPMRPLPS